MTQGKNIADVAKEAGVKHLIWSSLCNATKGTSSNVKHSAPRKFTDFSPNTVSGGKLPNVPHFDGKAEVEEYINAIGVPATFFLAGFYMSNLKMFMKKVQSLCSTWGVSTARRTFGTKITP